MSGHNLQLLGRSLKELVPLIEDALRELDKPGTRALRRKLDGKFHFVVNTYGVLQRMRVPQSEWDNIGRLHYRRATVVWPAGVARKGKLQSAQAPAGPAPMRGLRLAVDNTKSAFALLSAPESTGGAQ